MLTQLLAAVVRWLRARRTRARQRIQWLRDESLVHPGTVVHEHAVIGRRFRNTSAAWIDPCTIGPYALIGGVVIRSANHHTEFANMQEWVQQRIIKGRSVLAMPEKPVVIGANTWIGDGATILPGVEIGDGAIVGAGSVVTKSIPAYAIAVGTPAKVVKYRFPDEIVELVRDVKWWDWSDAKLAANKAYFEIDLTTVSPDDLRRAIAEIVEA